MGDDEIGIRVGILRTGAEGATVGIYEGEFSTRHCTSNRTHEDKTSKIWSHKILHPIEEIISTGAKSRGHKFG